MNIEITDSAKEKLLLMKEKKYAHNFDEIPGGMSRL